MKKRKNYDDEYKRAIVCLITNHNYSVSRVSKIFTISTSCLNRWIALFREVETDENSLSNESLCLQKRIKALEEQSVHLQETIANLNRLISVLSLQKPEHTN